MKKIISQISLITLIIIIGMSSVFITNVNADSRAGLNISSATEGGTFTVSLILENNIIDAEAFITVKYSDGSEATGKIVYSEGMGDDYKNLATFPAKVAGTTKIIATQILLSDNSPTPVIVEENGSKEETITIQPKPSSNQGNSGSTDSGNNNSGNSETQNPSTTTKPDDTTQNTPKEPEIVNPTFKDVNEKVYALKGCNVRSSCSTEINSNKIGGLVKGQSVTRTGYDKNWSRISFNGKTAYVATSLLTTEEPKKEENVVNNTVDNTVKNEVVNEVTNEVANNTVDQNAILGNIQNEIGVLPEVGKNVTDYMFTLITIITLSIIMFVNYKLKDE